MSVRMVQGSGPIKPPAVMSLLFGIVLCADVPKHLRRGKKSNKINTKCEIVRYVYTHSPDVLLLIIRLSLESI